MKLNQEHVPTVFIVKNEPNCQSMLASVHSLTPKTSTNILQQWNDSWATETSTDTRYSECYATAQLALTKNSGTSWHAINFFSMAIIATVHTH